MKKSDKKNKIIKIESLLNLNPKTEINSEKHFWNYCCNCGEKLDSRKCKLICHKCGFYHNCSEP